MSYILDALKKAEADRDPATRASLAIEQRERHRYRWLIYLAIAALIGNAMILLWLFVPDSAGPGGVPRSATATAPAPQPAGKTAAPQVDAGRLQPATGQSANRLPAATSERIAPSRTASRTASIERTTLAGLPAAARQRFPELTFSTHIFAEDPASRAVVVNGTRLLEGDRLAGLTVEEITEEGAVFAFERYLVTVPVLEGWN